MLTIIVGSFNLELDPFIFVSIIDLFLKDQITCIWICLIISS